VAEDGLDVLEAFDEDGMDLIDCDTVGGVTGVIRV